MNESRKHIVLITPGFAKNEEDTTCIPPLQLYAKTLAKNELCDVSIVALEYPHTRENYEWYGITVYPCYSKLGKVGKWPRAFRVLRKLDRMQAIDVLHCFWLTEAAFVAYTYQFISSAKVLVTLMGQDALVSNRYRFLANIGALSLVSISKNQARELSSSQQKNIVATVPFGLESLPSAKITNKQLDIVAVGSLIPLKNYSLLIDLLERLVRSMPNLKAELLGDGPEKEVLQDKIDAKHLNTHILLRGKVERSEVLQSMARAKVFVHTSIYEGQGFVFSEALSNECKIVSFNVGMATPNEDWKVCSNLDEMENAVLQFLTSPVSDNASKAWTMQETVKGYLKEYEVLSQQVKE